MTIRLRERRGAELALALAAIGLVVLGAAVPYLLGTLRLRSSASGIPESAADVQSLLLASRVLWRLFSVVAIGSLLAAACLLPSDRDQLSSAAVRAKWVAAGAAVLAAGTACAVVVLSTANTYVLPLEGSLDPALVRDFVVQSPQAKAWLWTGVFAVMSGVTAIVSRQVLGAWAALVLAVTSILPPVLVGHASSFGNHDLVTSALIVHVGASSLWVGGVIALFWVAATLRAEPDRLVTAARRFSAMALPLFVLVGITGAVNALYRMDTLGQLATTAYGALVATKVLTFVVLGTIGYTHRRSSIRQLDIGQTSSFRWLIIVEAAILLSTLGLSGALASTAPPAATKSVPSIAEIVLGFPVPPSPTWAELVTGARIDVLIAAVLIAGSLLYGIGVARLRRRGDSWSIGRTASWYGGIALLAAGTMSGLSTYGRVSFSFHMIQHMTLSMIAPLLLTLASPITLALRSMKPAHADGVAGPREWLLAALHSRLAKVVTHPLTALALFITAPYIVYFSDLFEFAMRNHWAHLLMQAHFVVVGFLFYQSLIGTDPIPFRFPYPLRLIGLMIALASHSFFAIALMSSDVPIASDFYTMLDRSWWPDLLREQNGGASFAWAFGELPGVLVMVALLFRWSRDDDQRARQIDRAADRDADAELAAYNEMLAARSDRPGSRQS